MSTEASTVLPVGDKAFFAALEMPYLVGYLLDQPWHKKCVVIPNYMPPYPQKDTSPSVVVRYDNGTEYSPFLRYIKGPKQGFFWDVYGDDMQSVELAVIALSKAPVPIDVSPIVLHFPARNSLNE